jgi:hypothetical protein
MRSRESARRFSRLSIAALSLSLIIIVLTWLDHNIVTPTPSARSVTINVRVAHAPVL